MILGSCEHGIKPRKDFCRGILKLPMKKFGSSETSFDYNVNRVTEAYVSVEYE